MPLIQILFLIAVNLVAADVPSFTIVENGTTKIEFTRQKDGGWEVKEPKERRGIWRLNKTKVSTTRHDGGSETDIAQQMTIPENADWKTLKELNAGKTKIRIDRQKTGATVTFVNEGKSTKHEIRWPETRK